MEADDDGDAREGIRENKAPQKYFQDYHLTNVSCGVIL